jgi:hypothetical protein
MSQGHPLSDGNGTDHSPRQADWPAEAHDCAIRLHQLLSINDRDWHALKGQRPRRAAEQLAAALVQLLSGDRPTAPQVSEARQRALSLVDNASGWLRGELSDPGCESHQKR